MPPSSLRSLRVKPRRVSFSGAEVIEYDASLAPVVRFCGVFGCNPTADAMTLECQARGLDLTTTSTLTAEQQLTLRYIEELQQFLRQRGFKPISNELTELQTQRRVVELLLALTSTEDKENVNVPASVADILEPAMLRHAQLAKKQLEGLEDDGYAFGRRFLSIATFVEMLSSEELLTTAKAREMEQPKLDQKQRAAVKALDRELLGLYGTAEGRPLRTLTLRQLVTEAEKRGMLGPDGEKAREMKGKKSKRAWVDMLRPVIVAEVRAAKIREKEEEMLRQKLVQVLEKEKRKEQHGKVVEMIDTMMKRLKKTGDEGSENAEPEGEVDATLDHGDHQNREPQKMDKACKFLEVLGRTVFIPNEAEEEVDMEG